MCRERVIAAKMGDSQGVGHRQNDVNIENEGFAELKEMTYMKECCLGNLGNIFGKGKVTFKYNANMTR